MNDIYTVGELAKQMKITVRTLQYYDKINLLKPSFYSEGGRRLYTNKDMIHLHQILSLKYLGFSLEDIQKKVLPLNTPKEVQNLLKQQMQSTKQLIFDYQKALITMEKMNKEIEKSNTVDFQRYADIITFIRNNNEHYWVLNCFDDQLIDYLRSEFKDHPEQGVSIYHKYEQMVEVATSLQQQHVLPDSEQGIAMAKQWWDMVMEFTKGDMTMLVNLEKFNQNKDGWDPVMAQKQQQIDGYIEKALEAYLKQEGLGEVL